MLWKCHIIFHLRMLHFLSFSGYILVVMVMICNLYINLNHAIKITVEIFSFFDFHTFDTILKYRIWKRTIITLLLRCAFVVKTKAFFGSIFFKYQRFELLKKMFFPRCLNLDFVFFKDIRSLNLFQSQNHYCGWFDLWPKFYIMRYLNKNHKFQPLNKRNG